MRLYAANFVEFTWLLDSNKISQRLERLQERNFTSTKKNVHISLNFHPADQLTSNMLIKIAREYMEDIGFGRQPYVVYQHNDAGHPHLHIISTNIRSDGKRIQLYNPHSNISNIAAQKITFKYRLAGPGQSKTAPEIPHTPPKRIKYGEMPAVAAISSVLEYVLPRYTYTCLPELNAILGLHNLYADMGKPGGTLDRKKGLVYRILDDNGKYIGRPVPAKRFDFPADRTWLEKKYLENSIRFEHNKDRILVYTALTLRAGPTNWPAFSELLRRERINVIPYMDASGLVREMVFVDFKTETALMGTHLSDNFVPDVLGKLGLAQPFQLEQPLKKDRMPAKIHLSPADRVRALKHLHLAEDRSGQYRPGLPKDRSEEEQRLPRKRRIRR